MRRPASVEVNHDADVESDRSITSGTTASNHTGASSTTSGPKSRKRHRSCATVSSFFTQNAPQDWSMMTYLYALTDEKSNPRFVLGSWHHALKTITSCSSCFSSENMRNRAQALMDLYNQKGKGSDREVGKLWLHVTLKGREEAQTQQRATINNHGPAFTFYAEAGTINNSSNNVGNSPLSQSAYGIGLSGSQSEGDNDEENKEEEEEDDDDDERIGTRAVSVEDEQDVTAKRARSSKSLHSGLERRLKWKLASGRFVEDVLIAQIDTDGSTEDHMARSLVIDISSPRMANWFTEEEWDEICAHVPSLSEPASSFMDYLRSFDAVSTRKQLRAVLENIPCRPADAPYNRNEHFDIDWARRTIWNLLDLLEASDEPLRGNNHAEDWFSMQLWSSIIDQCFRDVKGISVERKEITCVASEERKNRNRNATGKGNHRKRGPRLDGVIRTVEDDCYEYGGMEVARSFKGLTSSKWLDDARKLSKVLRDMLRRLQGLVHKEAASKLQVVGFMTQGLSCQILRMNHPKGYVCLLQREEILKVPSHVGSLVDLMVLLLNVVQAKMVVKQCVSLVKNPPKRSLDEARREKRGEGAVLPWSADTP